MPKITYAGPGNSWNVTISKSTVTGKRDQIADVGFRTACTFVKTHTAPVVYACGGHDADSLDDLAEAMTGDRQ